MPHILLIEDSPLHQYLAKVLFSRQGLMLDLASTYQEALQLMKERLYNLILIDQYLPDLTVTMSFKDDHPLLKETFLCLLSTLEATNHTFDHAILKPLNEEKLRECLELFNKSFYHLKK